MAAGPVHGFSSQAGPERPGDPYVEQLRSEWIPMSAAALITGAMTLVLGQLLNPGGSNESPLAVLEVAAESSGRWMAMSVLLFVSAVMLILGLPSVLSLSTERARVLGLCAVAVFALGSVGVAAVSAVMVMFRAMALESAVRPARVAAMLDDTGLNVMLNIWVVGFQGGVLLIAFALLRAGVPRCGCPCCCSASWPCSSSPRQRDAWSPRSGSFCWPPGITGIAVSAASPQHRRDQITGWG